MSSQDERVRALGRLMAAVRNRIEGGETVPCLVEARAHLWISEDGESQRAAAFGCASCPAMQECRTYVTQWPEPAGVWAGKVGKRAVAP